MARAFVSDIREHPYGEQGTRTSLDRVAEYVAEGISSPYVRTWAIDRLVEARDAGQTVDNPAARARVILQAAQTKLWVPDPVNAEYIPKAHLLACDPKKPHQDEQGNDIACLGGDDCDGLLVMCASAFGAVGLHVAVVGHGYDGSSIEHVLCVVWFNEKWNYADPSLAELRLGECVPFKRERVIGIPNRQVLCDASACFSGAQTQFNPEKHNFVERGIFVGVGAPPTSMRGLTSTVMWEKKPRPVTWVKKRTQWLGQTPAEQARETAQKNEHFTTLEKILLGGLAISVVTLGLNVYDHFYPRTL
jgi:hypothetical protein